MRQLQSLAIVLALAGTAAACGGGGGSLAGGFKGGGFGRFAGYGGFGGGIDPRALAATNQVNAAKASFAAQASARRAALRPARLAKFARARTTELAQRSARKDIRIAKAQARQQQQQEFLAKARTWTDNSGQHQVQAVLVGADSRSVQLRREGGEVVRVPLTKLSLSDRLAVSRMQSGGGTLLAGL